MQPPTEPKPRRGRFWGVAITAAGLLLLACSQWPLLIIPNRIEPVILGLPFFVFWMLALNILVFLLLAFAYWKLE